MRFCCSTVVGFLSFWNIWNRVLIRTLGYTCWGRGVESLEKRELSKKEISHHIFIESLKLLSMVSGVTSSFSSVIKRLSLKARRKACFSLSSQRTSVIGDRVKLPFPHQRLGTWRIHPGGRTSRANVMARLGHCTLSLAESFSEKHWNFGICVLVNLHQTSPLISHGPWISCVLTNMTFSDCLVKNLYKYT